MIKKITREIASSTKLWPFWPRILNFMGSNERGEGACAIRFAYCTAGISMRMVCEEDAEMGKLGKSMTFTKGT